MQASLSFVQTLAVLVLCVLVAYACGSATPTSPSVTVTPSAPAPEPAPTPAAPVATDYRLSGIVTSEKGSPITFAAMTLTHVGPDLVGPGAAGLNPDWQ